MKHMNRVIVLVLSLVLLLGLTTTALAADGNVSFSSLLEIDNNHKECLLVTDILKSIHL